MKPPFKLNSNILNRVTEINFFLGKIELVVLDAPKLKLRKANKIKTIYSTLAIEGNTLTLDRVTDIIDQKRVVGSKKEIIEVTNAVELYDQLLSFDRYSIKSFLKAHKILMKNLVPQSGIFRSKNVGVLKGSVVKHLAPKPNMLAELMGQLFKWLKEDKETHYLLKSCILHYELEFIHPFVDGNGRMGRFWQTLYLSKQINCFQFIPIENLIHQHQQEYYDALERSDLAGESTPFIEFMLELILIGVKEFLLDSQGQVQTAQDRFDYARRYFKKQWFSRKDYLQLFPQLSTATASRDVSSLLKENSVIKKGEGNQSQYRFQHLF